MQGSGRPSSREASHATLHHGSADEWTPLLNPPAVSGDVTSIPPNGKAQDDERTLLAENIPTTRLVLIFGTSWTGVFLGSLDSTIIATLSAPIASEFNSLTLLSWFATAYLIANAASQPIAGRLTDIFGRGLGLAVSNVLFGLGNLVCGLATNQYAMIAGRLIAGIGGGGLISVATFLGSDIVPLRRRGLIQGIANLWFGSGALLGAVIGGLFQDHTQLGWRLAFLVQVPPALLLAPAAWFLITVRPKQSDKSYLARIDFVGVFFTCSFLILLLLGLNTGGTIVPWKHPLPLTALPLSIVLFAGFVWWEHKAPQPIIPMSLLRQRTIVAASIANFFITMLLMTSTFYIPLYLQILGNSTTTTGVKFLPSPLGAALAALGTGYAMAWTGKYLRLAILGTLVLITGTILFALQNENSSAWLTCIGLLCVGAGYSTVLTTTQVACIAAVDHSQQAVVTSATFLARSIGGTVGITMASAIYQNTLKERLWGRFGDASGASELIPRILDGLEGLKKLPEGWWDGVIASFIEAFRGVWLMTLCWAILALISVSFMRQHKLHSRLDRS